MGALTPLARESLAERAATVILEREDEGHLRYTPEAVWERLVTRYPELYHDLSCPEEVRAQLLAPGFLGYLEQRRTAWLVNRLPAQLMKDRIGRRVAEIAASEFFRRAEDPAYLAGLSATELRNWLKAGLDLVLSTDPRGGLGNEGSGESRDAAGVTLGETSDLIASLPAKEQELLAQAIARKLMAQARAGEVIEGQAT